LFTDYIINGSGVGEVGEGLQSCRFDPLLLRPYIDKKGRKVCSINTGKTRFCEKLKKEVPVINTYDVRHLMWNGIDSPVFNATTLRKDEWKELDRVVLSAARLRMQAWQDLLSRNTFGGFNAMNKMILEHETMSDPGRVVVDMDGMSPSTSDTPLFQLEGLPLPITHGDFYISKRRLLVSRNSGTPIDTAMGEAIGRRVAEEIEQTLIGTVTGATYGLAADYGRTPTVYGYTNFPARNVKADMTAPTGSNGATILADWLELRQLLYDARMHGPYMVYVSDDWDQYLDGLFSTSEPSAGTLRERLMKISGIIDIKRLDFLTDTFTVLMVQMTPDVVRAVNGMGITTVQWESHGGMRINFKVMAIQVPQIRADYYGRCGIAHGTVS
jgi:hypothetical protein